MSWLSIAIFVSCLVQLCLADENGMDMSMDVPMNLAMGNMLPYLHFTPGDTLWFLGWVPHTKGAMVGACIGIFLFAILERWISACRSLMELHWSTRYPSAQLISTRILIQLKRENITIADKLHTSSTQRLSGIHKFRRLAPPFIPAHDITRGVVFAAHALLGYLFMLTVMTFQLGFILSLVVGLGVGETMFGRFSPAAHLR
ncbi:Ctr copper transporter family-domain-containing protein [Phlebopus sp. FC_14]|nr:Ctr copper transporter family-domain-containing protein [Phlebopus sp. FC_14]